MTNLQNIRTIAALEETASSVARSGVFVTVLVPTEDARQEAARGS